jgi:hypothetical protein
MEEAGVINQRFRLFRACREFLPLREPVLIFEVRRHRISTVEVPYDANGRSSPTEQELILARLQSGARGLPVRAYGNAEGVAINLVKHLGIIVALLVQGIVGGDKFADGLQLGTCLRDRAVVCCVRHTLVEVDSSKPVHRVGLAAIGAADTREFVLCVGAAQKALVIDFPAPLQGFDNGEFARAAATALRDEFGHTLVFFGQEDGKNAASYGKISRVG